METIAVWFSCGAASAVAAKKTIEIYGGTHRVRVINNPIAEEHGDNRRFLRDVQDWLGIEIELAINPKFPKHSVTEVWERSQAMAFPWGAPCTVKLKKHARACWEKENDCHAIVLGFTAEEQKRHDRLSESEILPVLPVLIDLGLTKQNCFDILHEAGILLPESYRLGFPNANCIGCCKASAPEYWNLVRRRFPAIFEERAQQSRALAVRLVELRGKRIFLDELHPEQRSREIKPLPAYQCSLFCD